MNIYQMYEANGRKYGFYVHRTSWSLKIAKIINISDLAQGDSLAGDPPCYHQGSVLAEFYKAKRVADCTEENYIETMFISYPCSYQYEMI